MDLTLFSGYVRLCAATLVRAHARTSDPAQISGYLNGAHSALARLSPLLSSG